MTTHTVLCRVVCCHMCLPHHQVFYFSDMKEGYKANSRLMGLRGKRVSGSQEHQQPETPACSVSEKNLIQCLQGGHVLVAQTTGSWG